MVQDLTRKPPLFDMNTGSFVGVLNTELPLAAIVAGLPNPQQIRDMTQQGGVVMYESVLPVKIQVVFFEKDEPDPKISEYASDVWKAIHSDMTWKKSAIRTEMKPDSITEILSPYAGFMFSLDVRYVHKDEI